MANRLKRKVTKKASTFASAAGKTAELVKPQTSGQTSASAPPQSSLSSPSPPPAVSLQAAAAAVALKSHSASETNKKHTGGGSTVEDLDDMTWRLRRKQPFQESHSHPPREGQRTSDLGGLYSTSTLEAIGHHGKLVRGSRNGPVTGNPNSYSRRAAEGGQPGGRASGALTVNGKETPPIPDVPESLKYRRRSLSDHHIAPPQQQQFYPDAQGYPPPSHLSVSSQAQSLRGPQPGGSSGYPERANFSRSSNAQSYEQMPTRPSSGFSNSAGGYPRLQPASPAHGRPSHPPNQTFHHSPTRTPDRQTPSRHPHARQHSYQNSYKYDRYDGPGSRPRVNGTQNGYPSPSASSTWSHSSQRYSPVRGYHPQAGFDMAGTTRHGQYPHSASRHGPHGQHMTGMRSPAPGMGSHFSSRQNSDTQIYDSLEAEDPYSLTMPGSRNRSAISTGHPNGEFGRTLTADGSTRGLQGLSDSPPKPRVPARDPDRLILWSSSTFQSPESGYIDADMPARQPEGAYPDRSRGLSPPTNTRQTSTPFASTSVVPDSTGRSAMSAPMFTKVPPHGAAAHEAASRPGLETSASSLAKGNEGVKAESSTSFGTFVIPPTPTADGPMTMPGGFPSFGEDEESVWGLSTTNLALPRTSVDTTHSTDTFFDAQDRDDEAGGTRLGNPGKNESPNRSGLGPNEEIPSNNTVASQTENNDRVSGQGGVPLSADQAGDFHTELAPVAHNPQDDAPVATSQEETLPTVTHKTGGISNAAHPTAVSPTAAQPSDGVSFSKFKDRAPQSVENVSGSKPAPRKVHVPIFHENLSSPTIDLLPEDIQNPREGPTAASSVYSRPQSRNSPFLYGDNDSQSRRDGFASRAESRKDGLGSRPESRATHSHGIYPRDVQTREGEVGDLTFVDSPTLPSQHPESREARGTRTSESRDEYGALRDRGAETGLQGGDTLFRVPSTTSTSSFQRSQDRPSLLKNGVHLLKKTMRTSSKSGDAQNGVAPVLSKPATIKRGTKFSVAHLNVPEPGKAVNPSQKRTSLDIGGYHPSTILKTGSLRGNRNAITQRESAGSGPRSRPSSWTLFRTRSGRTAAHPVGAGNAQTRFDDSTSGEEDNGGSPPAEGDERFDSGLKVDLDHLVPDGYFYDDGQYSNRQSVVSSGPPGQSLSRQGNRASQPSEARNPPSESNQPAAPAPGVSFALGNQSASQSDRPLIGEPSVSSGADFNPVPVESQPAPFSAPTYSLSDTSAKAKRRSFTARLFRRHSRQEFDWQITNPATLGGTSGSNTGTGVTPPGDLSNGLGHSGTLRKRSLRRTMRDEKPKEPLVVLTPRADPAKAQPVSEGAFSNSISPKRLSVAEGVNPMDPITEVDSPVLNQQNSPARSQEPGGSGGTTAVKTGSTGPNTTSVSHEDKPGPYSESAAARKVTPTTPTPPSATYSSPSQWLKPTASGRLHKEPPASELVSPKRTTRPVSHDQQTQPRQSPGYSRIPSKLNPNAGASARSNSGGDAEDVGAATGTVGAVKENVTPETAASQVSPSPALAPSTTAAVHSDTIPPQPPSAPVPEVSEQTSDEGVAAQKVRGLSMPLEGDLSNGLRPSSAAADRGATAAGSSADVPDHGGDAAAPGLVAASPVPGAGDGDKKRHRRFSLRVKGLFGMKTGS